MASQEQTEGFKHLENLKEGEILQIKGKLSVNYPKKDDKVFVYRVLDTQEVCGLHHSGHPIKRYDFTALIEDSDGEILEYAYDSRYFERVTA